MKLLVHCVSIAAFLLLLSCGQRQQTFGVDDEKKRWTAEGWTYFETLGVSAEDTVMVTHMSGKTAREVTAFARIDGILTNRVYAQTQSLYLVVAMQRPTGDYFALVFTKPKP